MGVIETVDFRGDTLFAVENDDGHFVALKPIVEGMGLDWSGQLQRVKRDPILSEGMVVMPTPFGRGGSQEAVCLKLELVNGWLFTIETRRIKDEDVKSRVITYQRECYQVLFEKFAGRHNTEINLGESETQENENVKLRSVTEARHTFGAQAAAQLWFRLGLPVVPAMLHDPNQLNLLEYTSVKSVSEVA
jgi:hypothetical protein